MDNPLSPLIKCTIAPSYKISKQIIGELKDRVDQPYMNNIKNTKELPKNLRNAALTNKTRMVSFDITKLYNNLPITETI